MVVPIGWKIEELGNEIEFQNGVAHENIIKEYGKYIVANSKFISTEGKIKKYSDVCMTPCYANDILMVMSDVPNGRAIGKCFFVEAEDRYTLNQRICRMRSYFDNAKLLYYVLNRNRYFLSFDDGVKQTNLRKEDILRCSFILPKDIEEQNAISGALSDIDNLIISLRKLIDKKEDIKQGAMQELLTGKRRLTGFSGEWVKCVVKDILSVGHGQVQHSIENEFGHYPILATGGCIGYTDEFLWDEPSVLIGRKGTIDKPQYVETPFWTIDTLFYTKIKKEYIAKFVYYKFCLIDWLKYNEASGVPSLNANVIENIEIAMPTNIKEQQAIAQILSDMDKEIEQLEKKLAKYQQIKQGMMQELLTGHIRLVETEKQGQDKMQIINGRPSQNHNQHFDDAVMIAGIVNAFYSDKYPLGRKKIQKLLYLLRRKEQADVSAFHKKVAGPYADTVRYKGGEPIAKKNKYIQEAKGKMGSSFSKGENIQRALAYLKEWNKQQDIEWLITEFRYTKVDELELLATIDMAMCDLSKEEIPITVQTIKDLIQSAKEWKDKLKKTYFSDSDIQRAIVKCREMFKGVF